MSRLVTRIKELRFDQGLSQADLADRVGVRRETIVHLEAGRYNPSLRLAWDIAHVFGLTVDQVFSFEEGQSNLR
jgi:putative transcriptional regulator